MTATAVACDNPHGPREREIGIMVCYVYVLGTADAHGHRTYVGWTTDLDQRLARHNAGTGARSTRGRVWVLLYAERHASRVEAMRREWRLKRDRAFRRRIARSAFALPERRRSSGGA